MRKIFKASKRRQKPPPAISIVHPEKQRRNCVVFLEPSHLQEVYLSPLILNIFHVKIDKDFIGFGKKVVLYITVGLRASLRGGRVCGGVGGGPSGVKIWHKRWRNLRGPGLLSNILLERRRSSADSVGGVLHLYLTKP